MTNTICDQQSAPLGEALLECALAPGVSFVIGISTVGSGTQELKVGPDGHEGP